MPPELIKRLHKLIDLRESRTLSNAEQREMENLMDEWNENELMRFRRLNAISNL